MGVHHRCHNDDKGDLADLRRLDLDRQEGEVQPAPVTGGVIGTEGDLNLLLKA